MSTIDKRSRVLITGSAGGLGLAMASVLAERGCRLWLTDIDADGGTVATESLRAKGASDVRFSEHDVRLASDWQQLANEVVTVWGGLDLLINNAGVAVFGPIDKVSEDDWRFVVDINVWGVVHGCRIFAPMMIGQGAGHILNVASAAAFTALPDMSAYNVSKAAVLALSETMYSELGARGIGVSVLCPTFFRSNLESRLRVPDEAMRKRAQRFFARSETTAAEVAKLAIAGIERGDLHIHPMADGRKAWRLKRWLPGRYFRGLVDYQRKLRARS